MATRRPRDRKQQILAAASELFREHGYHNVSVVDVTTKVDIAASALYRHYRNKHDLLYYAVLSGLDSLQESVSSSTDLDALLSTLSVTSTGRRGLPILWQREARYLEGRAASGTAHSAAGGDRGCVPTDRGGSPRPVRRRL